MQKPSPVTQYTDSYKYNGKTIRFKYYCKTKSSPIDTLLFLGTGQRGKLPLWTAQAATHGTAVVEGAPHWHARDDAKDLYEFMAAYSDAAFDTVINKLHLKKVNIIGESQAVPGLLHTAIRFPERIGTICLIAPLGFSSDYFGNNNLNRVKTLQKRALQTMTQRPQSPFYDSKNIYLMGMLFVIILRGLKSGAAQNQYAKGLAYDSRTELETLLKNNVPIHIFLGSEDTVFRSQEISEALKRYSDFDNLKLYSLQEATHASLGTRGGNKTLLTAIRRARQTTN